MKKVAALLILCLIGTALFSCKDDTEDDLAGNTWSLTPEGFEKGTYRTQGITLSTQVFQTVEATSQYNTAGDVVGSHSTLTLYFTTAGPPATGTYPITSVDRLSGRPNRVAIYLQTFDDPSTGISVTSWYSQEDSGQTLSFTFSEGKFSATFDNVVVTRSGTGPQTGTLSANISQQ